MQSENISTPIHVECNKVHQSKVCVPEFPYFVSGLDIQDKKSEYDSPVSKKSVAGLKIFQWPSRANIVVNLNIPI